MGDGYSDCHREYIREQQINPINKKVNERVILFKANARECNNLQFNPVKTDRERRTERIGFLRDHFVICERQLNTSVGFLFGLLFC